MDSTSNLSMKSGHTIVIAKHVFHAKFNSQSCLHEVGKMLKYKSWENISQIIPSVF